MMTSLFVLFVMLVVVGAEYPMIDSLQDKKFYIYPLSTDNWYAFPKCKMFEQYRENGGFGRVLDKDKGFFNSWHHSLFYSLFMRLKYSTRRTMNPAEADLFIVPYDFLLHEFYTPSYSVSNDNGTMYESCPPRRGKREGCPKSSVELYSFLQNSHYFQRHGGVDHVLIYSLTVPFYDCTRLKKKICKRCVGTGYFAFPPVDRKQRYQERDMSGFVSLPFPSYYHWHDHVKFIPWSVDRIQERPVLATYAGNTKVMVPDHTKLRRLLVSQCESQKNPDICTVVDMKAKKKSSVSDKTIASTRSQVMDVEPEDSTFIMRSYAKSVFCFVPPGDDPTRRGIVDVIIAGCIPVLFTPLTLHSQYPFHLDEKIASAVSIFIPLRSLLKRGSLSVIELLRSISTETIRNKQLKLAELAPRIVYAAPPLQLLNSMSDLADDAARNAPGGGVLNRWDPPFSDAASLALDGMLSRAARIKQGLAVMNPEKNRTWDKWMALYNITLI